jgi:hypothetical protein
MRSLVPVIALLTLLANTASAEEAEKEPESEPRARVDLEIVIGAGKLDALNPDPTSVVVTGQLHYVRALTPATAAGIVLSGQYEVAHGFGLGLRLPVAVGELRPDNDIARSTTNLGNVEVEAEYEKELSEHVVFFVGGHVALPTASGSELPTDAELAGSQAGIDPISADKYAVNKAVSNAFGDENTALWLAGYLGLVPVVGVKLRFGRVRIEPYVKLESMFSIRKDAHEGQIVELVPGGRIAVNVVPKVFDIGLRAWGSFTLTNHDGDLNIGVIEPEVRFGAERWHVTAGVLFPFAGELTSPQWFAGRLSGTVAF